MLSLARRTFPVLIAALLVITLPVSAGATTASAGSRAAGRHRVVAYYQTQYVTGTDGSQQYVSPLPLRGIATDIDVAALHLNSDGSVHLNDDPPSAAKFRRMWAELTLLRRTGTRVEAMLGGAGVGSFANLHADFPKYYGLLRQTLRTYHFDGVDLDIEEPFSLADTEHLIRQLRHDFGPHFVIAMAPVASDLSGQSTFSGGFSYSTLDRAVGKDVNWYNAQFYCGWGDLASTTDYDAVVAHGFSPARVVAGTVTNPANCGGYIDPATLRTTISALAAKYHSYAGVAGWEYFNSLGPDGPQSWYAAAKSAMRSA